MQKSKPKILITLRLPVATVRALTKLAKATGTTRTALIESALAGEVTQLNAAIAQVGAGAVARLERARAQA